jgi:hypothetical protein
MILNSFGTRFLHVELKTSIFSRLLRYSEGTELSPNSDSTYCFPHTFLLQNKSKDLTKFKVPKGRIITAQCTGRDKKIECRYSNLRQYACSCLKKLRTSRKKFRLNSRTQVRDFNAALYNTVVTTRPVSSMHIKKTMFYIGRS